MDKSQKGNRVTGGLLKYISPRSSKNEFTQKEVAELLKIKSQTIAFYANREIIIPEIDNPKGRGTTRKYSRNNLVEILLLKLLTKHGVSLKNTKFIIKLIKGKTIKEGEVRIGKFIKAKIEKDFDKERFVNNPFDLDFLSENMIYLCLSDIHKEDIKFFYYLASVKSVIKASDDISEIVLTPDFPYSSMLIVDITFLYKRVAKM